MGDKRVYNFAAGPSTIPEEVLAEAGAEIMNYRGTGMSIMEMSHRSKAFLSVFEEAKDTLYRNFFASLKPGGILFVGATEAILNSRNMGYVNYKPFFYQKPL